MQAAQATKTEHTDSEPDVDECPTCEGCGVVAARSWAGYPGAYPEVQCPECLGDGKPDPDRRAQLEVES